MTFHIYSKHLKLYNPFPHYTREAAEAHLATCLHPEWFGITEVKQRCVSDVEDYTETNQTYGEFALETSEILRRQMGDGL